MKKNKRILVTAIGGDIGQGVIKCIKESRPNDLIIGCDTDKYAAAKENVNKFYSCPKAGDVLKYRKFVLKMIKEEKINYILPVSEPEIVFFDKNRSLFDKNKVFVLIHEHEILETFFDKYETSLFLKRNNLPYPKTFLLDSYMGQISFPLVVKLRKSWGGKGMTNINNSEELSFIKKKMKDAIVQEYLGSSDEEYTATVFSDEKKYHVIIFKRQLGYGSLTKVAQLVHINAIKIIAEKIAKRCNLKGSLNIQMRKTSKGFVPFEINPRFSSTVYFRHFFGFKDVKWWLDMLEGKALKYQLKYFYGTGVRCVNEVFFELRRK